MANSDRIKSFYESFAAYLVKNRIIDNPQHTKIFGFLDKIFAQHTISSALEIGCGIGIISEYINKTVSVVDSLDISKKISSSLRER